ncbi:MAG: S8 family serine peptidase [Clostridia bacterium]|nr:S8 family serine peptidase [Clostridia bacterium]
MRRLSYLLSIIVIINIMTAFVFAYGETQTAVVDDMDSQSGRYIVTLKSSVGDSKGDIRLFGEASLFDDMTDEELTKYVDENIDSATALIPEINMVRIDDEQTLKTLIEAGVVEKYEPDHIMYLMGYDYTKNPHFSKQWSHDYINSSFAWDAGIFANEVRVAVIDSGVFAHDDLVNNLAEGYSYVDEDPKNYTDTYGHGTFVAGIIAAQCNDTGIVGLAHRATIVPLKVTNGKSLYMADAIQAMKDAVDKFDCDVINMSFGTEKPSDQLQNALTHVISKGAIIVSSSGNSSDETYMYPASYDEIVSVANAEKTDETLVIRSTSTHNDKVDIAAPGTNVYSLGVQSTTSVGFGSGTSYSCPFVSAAAALTKSIMPEINQAQFQYLVKLTANPEYITETQGANYWGAGLLDIEELLKQVLKMKHGEFYLSPPDDQDFGDNTSVYLTNLTAAEKDFGTFVSYNYVYNEAGIKRLNKFISLPLVLQSYESKEISLTSLGMFGSVKYSMRSDKLKPLIVPARTVTME